MSARRFYGYAGSAVRSTELGSHRGFTWWYWLPRFQFAGWPVRWTWHVTHFNAFWLHWYVITSFYWRVPSEQATQVPPEAP